MSWACRCAGKTDGETLKAKGIKGILGIKAEGDNFVVETLYGEKTVAKADALPERCLNCKSKKHMVYDELLGEEGEVLDSHRFDMVEKLENMTPDERFEFWRGELSPLHPLQCVPQCLPRVLLRKVRV